MVYWVESIPILEVKTVKLFDMLLELDDEEQDADITLDEEDILAEFDEEAPEEETGKEETAEQPEPSDNADALHALSAAARKSL